MAKLFVICGHGAGDCGAQGNGFQEAERVRVLGKLIKELGGDNVILGDINRNFYKDNGISNLNIPQDYQIIELHMDSDGSASPKGAHVIIHDKCTVDEYDMALAKYLSELLPGRSSTIVKRGDLANPARAYVKGYGYRLVEIGFISNPNDVSVFNANIENIAKGILNCFGIGATKPVETPKPVTKPQPDRRLDQIFEVGSYAELMGVHRVDQVLADRDSIWCKELTGDGGNSIQAAPLIKCSADGVRTSNQVFKVGDHFYCDEKFLVLGVDAATDAIQINVGGRVIWAYAKPFDEVLK